MGKLVVLLILTSVIVLSVGTLYPSYSNTYYPYRPPGKCISPPYNFSGSHSLFTGCVTPYDRVLYSQNIIKSWRVFSGRSALIRYPLPGYWRNEIISAVWIFDNNRNGTGGYPHIISGGVGHRNVTIELSSKPFRGFDFNITIYGH